MSAQAARAAPAGTARISALSDVSFGTVPSFASDLLQSQSICLYSKSPPRDTYRITASGSGAGGAFLLTSGAGTLPYEVQWSDAAGQISGSAVLPNQPLAGQQGQGSADDCSKGAASTASLIIIIRSTALASATSGTYSGTLTLLVAPE
jgi:spore coat protein U-like protein